MTVKYSPTPMTHHLMGLTEIAELLGLSRQRVHQLIREDPSFPEPVARLSAGLVWESDAVRGWAKGKGRI